MCGYNDEFGTAPPAPWMFGNAGREHMQKWVTRLFIRSSIDILSIPCHCFRFGTTKEQIAKIAWKNHKHSVNNPYSQFRDEYSLQQVRAAGRVGLERARDLFWLWNARLLNCDLRIASRRNRRSTDPCIDHCLRAAHQAGLLPHQRRKRGGRSGQRGGVGCAVGCPVGSAGAEWRLRLLLYVARRY